MCVHEARERVDRSKRTGKSRGRENQVDRSCELQFLFQFQLQLSFQFRLHLHHNFLDLLSHIFNIYIESGFCVNSYIGSVFFYTYFKWVHVWFFIWQSTLPKVFPPQCISANKGIEMCPIDRGESMVRATSHSIFLGLRSFLGHEVLSEC